MYINIFIAQILKEIVIPEFTEIQHVYCVFPHSLRPRASSSSSQSERSTSPLVMNSTQSLDIMPRFAISAEEEGKTDIHRPLYNVVSCCFAVMKHQC